MPSPAESEIDDDDIRDVLSNLIDKATDLLSLLYKSLLPSFNNVFVEEESLLSYDVANLSNRINKGLLTIIEQSIGVNTSPFVEQETTPLQSTLTRP